MRIYKVQVIKNKKIDSFKSMGICLSNIFRSFCRSFYNFNSTSLISWDFLYIIFCHNKIALAQKRYYFSGWVRYIARRCKMTS